MHRNPNWNTHPGHKPLGKKSPATQYNVLFPVQRFKGITTVL